MLVRVQALDDVIVVVLLAGELPNDLLVDGHAVVTHDDARGDFVLLLVEVEPRVLFHLLDGYALLGVGGEDGLDEGGTILGNRLGDVVVAAEDLLV